MTQVATSICQEPPAAEGDVVTILELSMEKMNMHARHEEDLNKIISQLSTESSKQMAVRYGNNKRLFHLCLHIYVDTNSVFRQAVGLHKPALCQQL